MLILLKASFLLLINLSPLEQGSSLIYFRTELSIGQSANFRRTFVHPLSRITCHGECMHVDGMFLNLSSAGAQTPAGSRLHNRSRNDMQSKLII